MALSREEMEKKLLKAGSVDEVKSIIEGNDEEISDEDAKSSTIRLRVLILRHQLNCQ